MQNISLPLITTRLKIEASRLSDLPRLKELYVAFCRHMQPLNGNKKWHEDDVERIIREGDLPPQGVKERFSHVTITHRQSDDRIGFIDLYNGYPQENVYYLGALYIDAQFQKSGYGQEVVEALIAETRRLGFSSMRLCFDMKNWAALNFWHAQGFNTITKVTGDKTLDEHNFMKIELTRLLK